METVSLLAPESIQGTKKYASEYFNISFGGK